MMRFSTLIKHPATWMTGAGADSTVVLTSRVRLARNVKNVAFPGWSKKAERIELLEHLQGEVEQLPEMKNAFSQEFDSLSSVQKQVLVERHLISREQAARGAGSAAVVNRNQSLSVMINEEDHLRIQSISSGLNIQKAYDLISQVDVELEEKVDYAFDPEFGYLTACPTNLGTGMRASAMLHLPGLAIGDHIGKVVHAVSKLGLAVRGMFGEGTESLGHMFQISNQSTLGESEEEIIDRMERVIGRISEHERNARQKMLEDSPDIVSDKISRAYGILKNAHLIESKEALDHLSMIRLGADLGCFSGNTTLLCNTLLMEIEPAHLQLVAGEQLDAAQRDLKRAEMIRARLHNLPIPDINL